MGEHIDSKGFVLVVALELHLRAKQFFDGLPFTLDLSKQVT